MGDPRIEAVARAMQASCLVVAVPTWHTILEMDRDMWRAAAKAALAAAGAVDAAAWQPIESAPKDGTCILVSVPFTGGDVVSWWLDGWRETTNGLRLRDDPKFWMPIPQLPEATP